MFSLIGLFNSIRFLHDVNNNLCRFNFPVPYILIDTFPSVTRSDVWNSTPNIHASGPPILAESSTALTDASRILHHRGPDGRGFHVDEDNGLAMGHTRLSIIDLDTGGQPIYKKGTGLVQL